MSEEFSDLIDWKAVAKAMDWKKLAPHLEPEHLRHIPIEALIGCLGAERIIEVFGPERVVRMLGIERVFDALSATLSDAQFYELLQRRQGQKPPGEGNPE